MSKVSRRQFLGTAAGVTAASAFPHVWIRPAWAQTKEVRVLAWTHFVPAYDKWFDAFAEQWSTKSGVKVTIDHIPHLQIPAKIAAEVATQSGHDIVQLVGTGTEKWAGALLDVQDTADKLAKKYGGWTPLADNYCKLAADGKFHSIPDFFIDFPGLYRKDLWTEVGYPNGPDTWDELHKGGMKLKAKGFPIGIGLAHHDDSRASWRAIMWSYGGSEVTKDGKTITYNSKEVREALKFNKALYKDCMTPEVLAWDDASNNRLLASGRGVVRQLPRLRGHQVLEERGRRKGVPGSAGRQLPRRRQGQHRLQHAVPQELREAAVPDHQRGPEAQAARAGRRVPLHHRLPGAAHSRRGRGLPAVHHGGRARPVRDRQDGPRADDQVGRGEDQGHLRQVRLALFSLSPPGRGQGEGLFPGAAAIAAAPFLSASRHTPCSFR